MRLLQPFTESRSLLLLLLLPVDESQTTLLSGSLLTDLCSRFTSSMFTSLSGKVHTMLLLDLSSAVLCSNLRLCHRDKQNRTEQDRTTTTQTEWIYLLKEELHVCGSEVTSQKYKIKKVMLLCDCVRHSL